MTRRVTVLVALLTLLSLSMPAIAQDPDDLSFEDGIAAGKLVVWFELAAPAAYELTVGLRRPAFDDPDWRVRMDSSVGVILTVERSVDRAEDVGPILPDYHDEAIRLYDAMGDAAAVCDSALVHRSADLADQCVEQMTDADDALLAFQVSLGLAVGFSPSPIVRAPRTEPVVTGGTPSAALAAP